MTTFAGLSAFTLTPFHDDTVDELTLRRLVERLAEAGVDSIGVLGSTGSFAYLSPAERRLVARAAVCSARETPVVVGISSPRMSHVQAMADDAQEAGASAVLLAPVSYLPLTDDEVFGLYESIDAALSVPLIVYDNPGTSHFTFSLELYARITALRSVASIKIPGVPLQPGAATEHVRRIREVIPDGTSIGVSGDATAAAGLLAGCDGWYSVLAGTLPTSPVTIVRAARAGDARATKGESTRLTPLWNLFARHGSIRVTAAIARHAGLVPGSALPLPLRELNGAAAEEVAEVVSMLSLDINQPTADRE